MQNLKINWLVALDSAIAQSEVWSQRSALNEKRLRFLSEL